MLWGRDAELAALRALLADARLVTVTGVGGVGKTALAVAAAGGAPVCELAGVDRPGEVGPAAAGTLGFSSFEAALVGLADGDRLVVLDNCEHVLDAAAALADRLVTSCPGVTVLATSREPLDVPGERVFPLAPLALPVGDDPAQVRESPAASLLLARARDAGVDLVLDAGSAPAVAELARRLDGLPLAIELAAARTRTLTPSEILAHLDHRLDLLARPRERGPARHRSLDAAIGWSYERLPAATRRFFERLGAFSGRFTAEGAQSVAGEPGTDLLHTVGHLDQLVGQSLLTVRRQAGRSWYGLLDTVRAFARARLVERGEMDAVRDRWVDTLVELAADAWRDVTGSTSLGTWSTVHIAQADLRRAVRDCLERDARPERAVALLRPLWLTVHSGPAEPVAELGDAVLARWPDRSEPGWAAAATVASFAHLALRDVDRSAELAGQALDAAPDRITAVQARRTLIVCELTAGRAEAALRWADEVLAGVSAGEQPAWASEIAALRAVVLAALGRTEEAQAQALAAHDQAVTLGSGILQAWATLTHGCLLALRDTAVARVELEALVQTCRDADYPLGEGAACRALGAVALVDGRPGTAAGWLGRALEVFVRIGHAAHLQVTLGWSAALLLAAGEADAGATLRRAAGRVRTPTSEILERAWLDPLLDGRPGEGRPVPLRDAVTLARGQLAELAAGSTADAEQPPDRFALEGSVWTVTFLGRTVRLPDTKGLRDLAALLARAGREVHCTELAGAAVEQPDTGEVLDAQARRRYEARIVELQADLTEAEDAQDRGRAEAASLELDLLVEQLTAASGLGGRARRTGGTAERARTAVTWRIRAAIRRIDEVHPDLGRHLRAAVRTGTWCSYQPEHAVDWRLR